MGAQDDYNEAYEAGEKAARAAADEIMEQHRRVVDQEVHDARRDEAERCAALVTMRADISRETAARLRREGSYTVRSLWPPFAKRTILAPRWGKMANDMELIAHAFDVVADCIRKGYDPRTLNKDHL